LVVVLVIGGAHLASALEVQVEENCLDHGAISQVIRYVHHTVEGTYRCNGQPHPDDRLGLLQGKLN